MMDWIGNVFIVIGLFMAGNKGRHAFLFSLIGESLWIVWSAMAGLYSLTFICVIFAGLAAINWFKWGKDEERLEVMLSKLRDAHKAIHDLHRYHPELEPRRKEAQNRVWEVYDELRGNRYD